MSGIRFTDEFKRDADAQVMGRADSVTKVSERLGISTKSLYTCRAQFWRPRKPITAAKEQVAKIKPLKKELVRVSEERDMLKKATGR